MSRRTRTASRTPVRGGPKRRSAQRPFDWLALRAHDIIYRFGLHPAFGVEYVSPSVTMLIGYTPEEFYEDPELPVKIVHPEDQPRIQDLFAHPAEQTLPAVLRWVRRDGQIVWTEQRHTPVFDGKGRVVAIEGIARDVTEWKRTEASLLASQRELEAKSEALTAINAIADTVYRSLDFETVVDRAAAAVVEYAHHPAVAILVVDEAAEQLHLLSAHGLSDEVVRVGATLPIHGSLSGLVVLRQDIVTSDDLTSDDRIEPTVRAALAAQGFRNVVGVPLLFQERVLGVMNLIYPVAHPLTAHERDTLLAIGTTIGLAMANAEHVTRMKAEEETRKHAEQQTRAKTEELQREARIAAALALFGQQMITSLDRVNLLERLCQHTAAALECDSSHTLLWWAEDGTFTPVAGYGAPEEEEEMARVVKVPRAAMRVLLERLEQDDVAQVGTVPDEVLTSTQQASLGMSSQLCMALRRGREIIGIQVAFYRDRALLFTAEQWRIARGIAQLASLFLAHARVVSELERASRLKSEFVATMSHELRTPLNVILGYSDLLLSGTFGSLSREQTNTLRQIEKNAEALLELINATLDVSRLDSGRVSVEVGEIQIPELIQQVDAETRDVRDKPGVHFDWQVAANLPSIRSDPLKLKVILKNLILNAMKFTTVGDVTVMVRERDRGIEFNVSDTGIGMTPDTQAIIFEPFRQGDGSSTRRFGGVGLGLYVVHRLVDLLGGRVAVDSEAGRGSTFRVWLPADASWRSA